jgi:hypothetical protein
MHWGQSIRTWWAEVNGEAQTLGHGEIPGTFENFVGGAVTCGETLRISFWMEGHGDTNGHRSTHGNRGRGTWERDMDREVLQWLGDGRGMYWAIRDICDFSASLGEDVSGGRAREARTLPVVCM